MTLDLYGAFPQLSGQQIEVLAANGERRRTETGDVLFREGQTTCDFFVVVEGEVAIVEAHGTSDERVLGVHGPGRFLGELGLVTGQVVLVTAEVQEPGEVVAVRAERLRELLAQDTQLADVILCACLVRRVMLIDYGAGVRLVGSRYSPDTRRLREFMSRNRLPYRWIEVEDDANAEALLQRLSVGADETPVVILHGSQVLRNPSNAELARAVGLRVPTSPAALCDLVVIGAGPGGLAAAVYGASEGLETMTLEGVATGGQAGTSSRIENYLGFPSGISGAELADRAIVQAQKFGARVSVPAEATALDHHDGHYVVTLGDGDAVSARTVVIATGVRYRKLDVPGADRLEGTSVYYATTSMERDTCRWQPVVVVGGGNSAGQATVFLAPSASKVQLVVRESEVTANMSRYLADRIARLGNVEVRLNSEVRELAGDRVLEEVIVENNRTGARERLAARALFVFIGADPRVEWLAHQVALDDRGYVLTGDDAANSAAGDIRVHAERPPFILETSAPGVFAVGDVRRGSIKRVAAAVGEGSTAVRFVHDHLEHAWGRTVR